MSILMRLFWQMRVLGVTDASDHLGKSYNTIHSAMQTLREAGLIVEHTAHKRNKLYRFDRYIQVLEHEYSE